MAIALVTILGLISWMLVTKQSGDSKDGIDTQTNTSETPSQPTTSDDPNHGYIVVKEWGVRFKSEGELSDIVYSIENDNKAVFSTEKLAKFDPACGIGVDSKRPLGMLTRNSVEKPDFSAEGGAFGKKIGEYYYTYVTPQSACSDSGSDTLQTKTVAEFKLLIATLEAAN